MLPRVLKAPQQSFFLMGPRGSGKSTLLRATFPDAHVFALLPEDTYQRLLSSPRLFRGELLRIPAEKQVIVYPHGPVLKTKEPSMSFPSNTSPTF